MAITALQLRAFADLPPVVVIPDENLQVFCDMAALIIAEDLSDQALSSERLDMIELNLAAHYAIVTYEKGGLTAQTVGSSEERYHLLSDKLYGLATTRFGQTALSLDTSGVLVDLATPPLRAQFRVI